MSLGVYLLIGVGVVGSAFVIWLHFHVQADQKKWEKKLHKERESK
jgi:hypothetical protein